MVIYTVGYPPRLVPVSLVLPGLDVRSGSVFAPYVAPAPRACAGQERHGGRALGQCSGPGSCALGERARACSCGACRGRDGPRAAGGAAGCRCGGGCRRLHGPRAPHGSGRSARAHACCEEDLPKAAREHDAIQGPWGESCGCCGHRLAIARCEGTAAILSGMLCPAAASCHQSVPLGTIALSDTKASSRHCQALLPDLGMVL